MVNRLLVGLVSGLGLSGVPLRAGAQGRPVPDTVYVGAQQQRLPTRQGAVQLVLTYPAQPVGAVQQVYTPARVLLQTIRYADAAATRRQGEALLWYPDGRLQRRETYVANLLHGQRQTFYPDGTLQQLEQFDQGNSRGQLCFLPDGRRAACRVVLRQPLNRPAAFAQGPEWLSAVIQQRLQYPPAALRQRRKGQVLVRCLISGEGHLQEATVLQSMGLEFDAEALRVVRGLPDTWLPALVNDAPVEAVYTVAVDFVPPPQP
ncbi:energy transducer TonB [Hymenobacter metallilatus]|uniref:TonB family protein n=1 Tax=Hymenobacter metallilatus TaxID=2493666 RepID=A0A3R9M6A8_9BACT|nr:energy transducer TonB [Hymenobacter metallilatus]RSK33136.1 TonB family protein [Hymenobacter metallilatus]